MARHTLAAQLQLTPCRTPRQAATASHSFERGAALDQGHLRAGRQRRRGRVSEGWTRQSAGVSGLGVASSHLRYSVAFVRHLVDCPCMHVHAHARRVYHNDVFCCVLRLQSNEFWCASFPGVLKGYVTVGVGASVSAVAGVVSFFGWPMLRVFGWPMCCGSLAGQCCGSLGTNKSI